ncbi:lasso RiPP family leader peptide-containing protein [Embleya sp. AB8]
MYSKPTALKVGSFRKLTLGSRPTKKDNKHRRRPKGTLL